MTGHGGGRPSGLRNPAAAVRGVGAGALAAMALVLLLAVAPLARLAGAAAGPGIGLVLGLAAVTVGLAAALRHRWAWWTAWTVPAALILGGRLHWSLTVLGVLFGLLWGYALSVRRTVLRPSASEPSRGSSGRQNDPAGISDGPSSG